MTLLTRRSLLRGALAATAAGVAASPAFAQLRLFRQPPDDGYFGFPDSGGGYDAGPPVWTDPGQDIERPVPPSLADRPDPRVLYAAVQGEPFPVPAVSPSILRTPFMRRTVAYESYEEPGTIVIDPAAHYLYFVNGDGSAIRYGVGVGRQGFGWSGEASIHDKQRWPDWYPPKEMLDRQPELRAKMQTLQSGIGMPGGPGNPLGARAMYLWQGNKDTLYRVHGTVEPGSIGRSVSSGCIRMINQDAIDLYDRVGVGARVVVLGSGTARRARRPAEEG